MKTSEALKIVGGLSKPSKMPGWAYGLPAAECKTGSKLAQVPGSVCSGCTVQAAGGHPKPALGRCDVVTY